ncbi:hypothetical protein CC78DRAFT_537079 [Lojkania enalia]|uniref:Uncharacterized protein n=1 Tax=Lojkania enalia TaxID=147567 RepID=A0A9P4MZF7_9PLEO|nr:hypothetical protein CC78DRAFT_537079 [Didymosphaeria enalia]
MADVSSPQPGAQLGPQPDLGLLAQGLEQAASGLQQASIEMVNFANLPPISQSTAIIQQMRENHQQTQQQIQQMQQQMQQMLQMQQQLQQQMQQLRIDITTGHRATEYNSIARLQNSGIRRSDVPLTALREYTTNADVQDFPATPAQLLNMSGPALDRILTALNLPTNGTTADKKQRLRFYVGLPDVR